MLRRNLLLCWCMCVKNVYIIVFTFYLQTIYFSDIATNCFQISRYKKSNKDLFLISAIKKNITFQFCFKTLFVFSFLYSQNVQSIPVPFVIQKLHCTFAEISSTNLSFLSGFSHFAAITYLFCVTNRMFLFPLVYLSYVPYNYIYSLRLFACRLAEGSLAFYLLSSYPLLFVISSTPLFSR